MKASLPEVKSFPETVSRWSPWFLKLVNLFEIKISQRNDWENHRSVVLQYYLLPCLISCPFVEFDNRLEDMHITVIRTESTETEDKKTLGALLAKNLLLPGQFYLACLSRALTF